MSATGFEFFRMNSANNFSEKIKKAAPVLEAAFSLTNMKWII